MRKKYNNYRTDGDTAYIEIYRKGIRYEAIVDRRYMKRISPLTWHINHDGYAINQSPTGARKGTFMHHLVLPRKEGYEIDHINRTKLDNRRINLRYATRAMNVRNTNVRRDSLTGIKGIRKYGNKWCARIQVNRKRFCVGVADTKEEAEKLYLKAVKKYHK